MKKVTVSECNEWISHLFNKDYTLHNLAVSGTVSNLREYTVQDAFIFLLWTVRDGFSASYHLKGVHF